MKLETIGINSVKIYCNKQFKGIMMQLNSTQLNSTHIIASSFLNFSKNKQIITSVFLAGLLSISQASFANTLISHSGATDPTTEGFTIGSYMGGPSTAGPIYNDLGNNAWSISGLARNSQYTYISNSLTTQQLTDINNNGAVLSVDLRVQQGLGACPRIDHSYEPNYSVRKNFNFF